MSEIEHRDWTPEINLLKGLSTRVGAIVEYVNARAQQHRQAMAEEAIRSSALSPDAFLERLREDDRLAVLFVVTLEAAGRIVEEDHARALGRVLAQAVDDKAAIDQSQLLAATIRDLEPPHIRALAVLRTVDAERSPETRLEKAIPLAKLNRLRMPRPESTTPAANVLRANVPCSTAVAEALAATLQRHGLIWNDPAGFSQWGITDYGHTLVRTLELGP